MQYFYWKAEYEIYRRYFLQCCFACWYHLCCLACENDILTFSVYLCEWACLCVTARTLFVPLCLNRSVVGAMMSSHS